MACPLFLPGPRLPMSEIYAGECSADSGASLSMEKLTRCCNPGYARTLCERAAASDIDSYRFLVCSDEGGSIEIAWASEHNHHPIAVGTLRLDHALSQAAGPLDHQARACAQSYLRQTGRL
jgi:hypothetical protein